MDEIIAVLFVGKSLHAIALYKMSEGRGLLGLIGILNTNRLLYSLLVITLIGKIKTVDQCWTFSDKLPKIEVR